MKKYISTKNAVTSSIYGKYEFIEGHEVPEKIALKFPRNVKLVQTIEVPDEIAVEVKENIITEFGDTEETNLNKKQRRSFNG